MKKTDKDTKNPFTGSSFDDFLTNEGLLEESEKKAIERLRGLIKEGDESGISPKSVLDIAEGVKQKILLDHLKNSVLDYQDPTHPVDDSWGESLTNLIDHKIELSEKDFDKFAESLKSPVDQRALAKLNRLLDEEDIFINAESFQYSVLVAKSIFKRERRRWLRLLRDDPELIAVEITRCGKVIKVIEKENPRP